MIRVALSFAKSAKSPRSPSPDYFKYVTVLNSYLTVLVT